jgi:Protein of unknown function (DUF2931)
MRKLNLLNKIYLVLFLGMIIAIAVKVFMLRQRDQGRFYFSVTLTAPDTYPVYLQQAYMVAVDGERNDIDDNRVNSEPSRWANVSDFEIRNRYCLPKALVLSYASYRDKKYYKDSIPLPFALIESIFKTSAAKGRQKSIITNTGSNVNGLVFLIGIANKGNIVVWLQGKDYERKLGVFHFAARQPQGEMWYDGKAYSGKHFFDVFELTPNSDHIKAVKMSGKDSLANYADSSTHYLDHPQ